MYSNHPVNDIALNLAFSFISESNKRETIMKNMSYLMTCFGVALLPILGLAADAGVEAKIDPASYDCFKLRDGLENCRIKFEREKKGRVAFLGGSITAARWPGNAWHFSIRSYLKEKFPHTEFDSFKPGWMGRELRRMRSASRAMC